MNILTVADRSEWYAAVFEPTWILSEILCFIHELKELDARFMMEERTIIATTTIYTHCCRFLYIFLCSLIFTKAAFI